MLPPTPEPPPTRQMPTWAVVLLVGLLVVIAGTMGEAARSLWTSPPTDAASVSRPTSAPDSSGPAYDATASAALAQLAAAFSTSVAPTMTPEPPTPTPTYAVATAIPPVLCGAAWVNEGEICEWPKATATPSPTPPPCLTPMPGEECRWNKKAVQ